MDFLRLVLLTALISSASAYDFYVGGRDGWTQNPSEGYNHWAERMRFQIHDKLVFKYKKGEDSVLVVKKEDYDSCDTKNPIKKLDDGDSVFEFDRSGPFYFVSGGDGKCDKGQKLIVVVLADRSKKSVTPTPAPSPPTSSPAPSVASPSPSTMPPTISPSPSTISPSPYAPPPSTMPPTTSPSPSTISPSPYSPSPSTMPPTIAPSPYAPSPSTLPPTSSSPSANSPTGNPTISPNSNVPSPPPSPDLPSPDTNGSSPVTSPPGNNKSSASLVTCSSLLQTVLIMFFASALVN